MKVLWIKNLSRAAVGGLIVVGCAYAGIRLMQHPAALSSSGGLQSTLDNVSDAEEQTLDSVLASIPGLQEVALSNDGNGTAVTATVNLPFGTEVSVASAVSSSLMQEYLEDAFEADSNLQQAQLYFVQDGQIVAGGALNRTAFKQWTVGASTGSTSSGLLKWMASLGAETDTPESVAKPAGWFETLSPVSTQSQ